MNKEKLLDKFKNLVILLRKLLSSFIKRLPNILIILIVGLITRHLVYIYSDINVFIEYTNPISLFYYFNFGCFTISIKSIDCSGIRLKYILKCINWDNLKIDSIVNGILSFINDYAINTSNMHWHGYYNSTDEQIGCSNDNTINKYSVMAMNKSGDNLSGNNTHRTRSLKRNIDFILSDDDGYSVWAEIKVLPYRGDSRWPNNTETQYSTHDTRGRLFIVPIWLEQVNYRCEISINI